MAALVGGKTNGKEKARMGQRGGRGDKEGLEIKIGEEAGKKRE